MLMEFVVEFDIEISSYQCNFCGILQRSHGYIISKPRQIVHQHPICLGSVIINIGGNGKLAWCNTVGSDRIRPWAPFTNMV